MIRDETDAEARLRAAFARGALDDVAHSLLDSHGPAVRAFLRDRLRSDTEADEVYAQFCEDLWRGLPQFEFRASLRSWAFTLARNAASRHQRDPRRRAARNQPLPDDSRLDPAAIEARSRTPDFRKTAMKERLRALRRGLPEQDQTLLVLRVDQQFSWAELSAVLSGDANRVFDEAAHNRELLRLRQRFKRAKEQLRKLAEQEGLISSE